MARPFYSYEVSDPDLDWLVSNFLFERPEFLPIEAGSLPIVLIRQDEHYSDVENIVNDDQENEDLDNDNPQ